MVQWTYPTVWTTSLISRWIWFEKRCLHAHKSETILDSCVLRFAARSQIIHHKTFKNVLLCPLPLPYPSRPRVSHLPSSPISHPIPPIFSSRAFLRCMFVFLRHYVWWNWYFVFCPLFVINVNVFLCFFFYCCVDVCVFVCICVCACLFSFVELLMLVDWMIDYLSCSSDGPFICLFTCVCSWFCACACYWMFCLWFDIFCVWMSCFKNVLCYVCFVMCFECVFKMFSILIIVFWFFMFSFSFFFRFLNIIFFW